MTCIMCQLNLSSETMAERSENNWSNYSDTHVNTEKTLQPEPRYDSSLGGTLTIISAFHSELDLKPEEPPFIDNDDQDIYIGGIK